MRNVAIAIALLGALACEDKRERLIAQTTSEAAAPVVIPSTTPASSASSASADPADAGARFDPKHKCPTGQTHFYLEGDFCRRRCLTNSDCAKKERCSAIEYPYVVDGGPAGMAKFCEGT